MNDEVNELAQKLNRIGELIDILMLDPNFVEFIGLKDEIEKISNSSTSINNEPPAAEAKASN